MGLFSRKPKKPDYIEMYKKGNEFEKEDAAMMITDESFLKEIVLTNSRMRVREMAINNPNLQDETFFQDIVLNGEEKLSSHVGDGQNGKYATRVHALKRCKDKKFLEEMSKDSSLGSIAQRRLNEL